MRTTKKSVFTTVTAVGKSDGLPEMVISTPAADRDGDRVLPQGAQIDNFLKNPVLLWAHQNYEVPIGAVTKLSVGKDGIRQQWRWLQNDPLADRVKNAWDQGVVRAASIGFMPIEFERNSLGGYDHSKWELTEISLVPVPANAQALRALKSLGLFERNSGVNKESLDRLAEAFAKALTSRLAQRQALKERFRKIGQEVISEFTGRVF